MKRSLATMISATWVFPSASVFVNCTNNSPNMQDRALAASNVAARASSSTSIGSTFYRVVKLIIRKFRRIAIVAILGGTLAACGNNREIQYDGTGTDEMRRSPCVCLPVEYQAPKFKWGAA